MECQPPARQESTEPAAAAAEEVVAAEAQESTAPEAVIAEDEAQEEVSADGGLVDIASILGAPTVTVVRSSL
jgi:ADP-heptose:LPS heptosyltransferase